VRRAECYRSQFNADFNDITGTWTTEDIGALFLCHVDLFHRRLYSIGDFDAVLLCRGLWKKSVRVVGHEQNEIHPMMYVISLCGPIRSGINCRVAGLHRAIPDKMSSVGGIPVLLLRRKATRDPLMRISVTAARTSHVVTIGLSSWKRWNFWTMIPPAEW